MDEQTQRYLKITGVLLFTVANGVLMYAGLDSPTQQAHRMLTQECENFLFTNDEFAVIPTNCRQEMDMLRKRLIERIRECDAYYNSDVPLSENVESK